MNSESHPDPWRAGRARRITLAPMMEWTDRFYRRFLREITRETFLFTEMVNCNAIVHGDRTRHLDFDVSEHPVALQLGGSDPEKLAESARIAEDWGYDEINLNCGCPSEKVQSGSFGACLMAEPVLVRKCVEAMQKATRLPVTIKTRLGIDHQDSMEFLLDFLTPLRDAGVQTFYLHARKAWLKGLSPRENREKPPLIYERVQAVKNLWPEIEVILNGGVAQWDVAETLIAQGLDGVMIGRMAYEEPWRFAEVDQRFYGAPSNPHTKRVDVIRALYPFVEARLAEGHPLNRFARHTLGLFHGVRGGRAWRRILTEESVKPGAGIEVLEKALAGIEE